MEGKKILALVGMPGAGKSFCVEHLGENDIPSVYFGGVVIDEAIIVAITAPRHVRHERLANRPRRPLTEEEATSREYAEIENLEKGGPIANADYTIINDEDPYKLIERLEHILVQTGFL